MYFLFNIILYTFIPFWNNLPPSYYVLFFLYSLNQCIQIKYRNERVKMFEILTTTWLFTYFLFHNLTISYFISSVALLEYIYYDSYIIGSFCYFYCYFLNIRKLYYLVLPFMIGNFLIMDNFILQRKYFFNIKSYTLWNLTQLVYFWFCSQMINEVNIC